MCVDAFGVGSAGDSCVARLLMHAVEGWMDEAVGVVWYCVCDLGY